MKENYKSRLLYEFEDLTGKIVKLGSYLENHSGETTNDAIELMKKQIESMYSYRDFLARRILLEMGEK